MLDTGLRTLLRAAEREGNPLLPMIEWQSSGWGLTRREGGTNAPTHNGSSSERAYMNI